MRDIELIREVRRELEETGYETFVTKNIKLSFNIIARKEEKAILLKVTANIDSLSREKAQDLKKLAYALKIPPLIIGKKGRKGPLIKGAVHERYGIKVLSVETFKAVLKNGEYPIMYVKRGGFYVKISGESLRKAREKMKLSMGDIARIIGVTRRTIYAYENDHMNPSLRVAIKLEEILGISLIEPIDVFKYDETICENIKYDSGGDKITEILLDCEYEPYRLKYAPFNLVAKKKKQILSVVCDVCRNKDELSLGKINILSKFSHLTKTKGVIVVERDKDIDKEINGVRIIGLEKLASFLEKLG